MAGSDDPGMMVFKDAFQKVQLDLTPEGLTFLKPLVFSLL